MKKLIKSIIEILIVVVLAIAVYFNYDKILDKISSVIDNGVEYVNQTGLIKMSSEGNLISKTEVTKLEDSGLKGESIVIEETYYPYYGLLSSNEQKIYKQVYENVKNAKTTFVPITDITVPEVNKVIEYVYNDHPEFFWIDTNYTYKYTEDNLCAQIILKFNETSQYLEEAQTNLDNVVTPIINEALTYPTAYEREKYVHDIIINESEYNENTSMNQTAYSALVLKKSVCAGYSRAFQYILTKLGIPTYYITGTSDGDHAWNIVKLDDGFYNVDITWDDNTVDQYRYFNLAESEFSKNHTRTRAAVNLPSAEGTRYLG